MGLPCTNASFRRRSRWTHPQQLLLLLVALCLWSGIRIFSPKTIWPLDQAEKCMDAPESIHCIDSFSNKTTDSRYSNFTNDVTHNTSIPTPIDTPTKELGHRHPNFTFDFPLCFVHVGKAAGSSVSCSLGLMYANCEGMPRQPPLPRTRYFHMRKNNCLGGEDIATLLVTVRNPLTRIQSWFDFEKDILPTRRSKQAQDRLRWKRGMLFNDCYDNFVDLVKEGLNHTMHTILAEKPVHMTCQERAWAAVMGAREFSYHEWYNYEHYWTALQNHFLKSKDDSFKPTMLVLRTEHLSADWSKLSKEDLFRKVNKGRHNSSGMIDSPDALSNDSANSSTRVLDERFWSNLCHAMCPEIKIYQQILQHAQNLNRSQVEESLSEVQALCPRYDPNQSSCLRVPQFPPLRVPRRQYLGETKKRLFAIG